MTEPTPLSAEEEAEIRESFAAGMRQGCTATAVFAREDIARLLVTLDRERAESSGTTRDALRERLHDMFGESSPLVERIMDAVEPIIAGRDMALSFARSEGRRADAARSPSLDALRALSEAATPGEWTALTHGTASQRDAAGRAYEAIMAARVPDSPDIEFTDLSWVETTPDGPHIALVGNGPTSPENAKFIAAAVNYVRARLAAIPVAEESDE